MEHRDQIILRKILSEIEIAEKMIGQCSLHEFIGIVDFPALYGEINKILK